MARPSADEVVDDSSSPEATEKKRKRDDIPEEEKLEIDVSVPEPPSKKAKRAEKKAAKLKASSSSKKTQVATVAGADDASPKEEGTATADAPATATTPTAGQRSEYGIWIGNLPFTCNKDRLRAFFRDDGQIAETEITRIHLPVPTDKNSKASNKGFAYVDFTTQDHLEKALSLSEKLIGGRRCLIKNAKSFEGRPDKASKTAEIVGGGEQNGEDDTKGKKTGKKDPAKRIFVGNLSFDVTQEELAEHFGQAGEVADIHMATFEDSGKCKGFAWVRFEDIEAASAAVRGFIYVKAEDSEDEESGDEVDNADAGHKKKKKVRRNKKHINRLHGRELRCEFAEDAQTRYKKRFGRSANNMPVNKRRGEEGNEYGSAGVDGGKPTRRERPNEDQRQDERRKKHMDARSVAPGKALAGAQRSSQAIVAGAGKKVTFD